MIPLLLTASVDTRGMRGAKFTALEREKMYVDTLNYYINDFSKKDDVFTLVFVENSGWDKTSLLSKLLHADNVKIEYMSMNPDEFPIEKGKSYNEMKLIDMATERSNSIQDAGRFFKLTGRFPILNIYKLLTEVSRGGVIKDFYCDCKDHKVYEWLHLPINGHSGESRCYMVSLTFYDKYFRGKYKQLNDYEGKWVELLLLDVIRETKHMPNVRCRFRTQPHFSGRNGHDLGKGVAFFYSTDNDSFALKTKMRIRQLFRWILPFWWC